MRSLNVAQAKAQLSAGFDLESFWAATRAQPLHKGIDIASMREGARY
ncbi:hypothetical protein KBY72_04670 [Cyanobium sp. BA5m-21]|nr:MULTISPECIES: hypothetical protein [unclassified Cyanobium]MCP9906472.1 hypothetical protein [Cyanobium sp. BA5m-21]MCP9913015.1 hypothetical protein [Cyanobium sp. BA20m-14]